jgi:hypothetical protein
LASCYSLWRLVLYLINHLLHIFGYTAGHCHPCETQHAEESLAGEHEGLSRQPVRNYWSAGGTMLSLGALSSYYCAVVIPANFKLKISSFL